MPEFAVPEDRPRYDQHCRQIIDFRPDVLLFLCTLAVVSCNLYCVFLLLHSILLSPTPLKSSNLPVVTTCVTQ